MIREVCLADIAVLAALHGGCFPDEPWRPEAMAEVLAMPGAFGFLSLDLPASPVGFLVALDLGAECEILALGVAASARRRGIAAGLLARLLAVADRRPVLLEVAEDNKPALGLYRTAGFEVVGRRPAYYRRANAPPAAALALRRQPPGSSASPPAQRRR
jgi:ribosomal-protein-alanine N-acetyltransferase